MDEVVEHLSEDAAALLFLVFGGGQFGDGGQCAQFFVELDCVNEVFGSRIGGRFVAARPETDAGRGGRTRFVAVPDGELQGVEDGAGAPSVELPRGEAGQYLGEGELDALAVVDGAQLEDGLLWENATVARGWAAGGVVVVAEVLAEQGGRAAAAARGVDVAAEKALGSRSVGGWIRFSHHGYPLGYLLRKTLKIKVEVYIPGVSILLYIPRG